MGDSETLLDAWLLVLRSSDLSDRPIIACGDDLLNHGQMLQTALGFASEVLENHERPTVAIVSKNEPEVLAAILATWLLNGIVAPIDPHAPAALLEGMLRNVKPDIVIARNNSAALEIARVLGSKVHILAEDTIPALIHRYGSRTAENKIPLVPRAPNDIALYIHTSSASSPDNLKAVPLSHGTVYLACVQQLRWLERTFPAQEFAHLRALGWAPWTHIMGISHDIGVALMLTGGCYIFATPPAAYCQPAPDGADMLDEILSALEKHDAQALSVVPLVIELAQRRVTDSEHIVGLLRRLKFIICAGAALAPETLRWARQQHLNLVLGMGMTEFGGALFHSIAEEDPAGYPLADLLIPDAELNLRDATGKIVSEGELYITSSLISRGYFAHPSTAFTIGTDGRTTFATGDIWMRNADRLVWRGRKDDYISLASGEQLDARAIERILETDPEIARACVVGDRFLGGASEHACAIIEPSVASLEDAAALRALTRANRELPPTMRISWARMLVLWDGEKLPLTRKGAPFRKKMQELYGSRLAAQQNGAMKDLETPSVRSVRGVVVRIVSASLGMPAALLQENDSCSLAELGMTSLNATAIVNAINKHFNIGLPPSTCYDHVYLMDLTSFVAEQLGVSAPAKSIPFSETRPCTDSSRPEVVIVGQALRLPGDIATPSAFWDALVAKRTDLLTPVPADRWDHDSFYVPGAPQPGDIGFDRAGFVQLDSFDAAFFEISAAEAVSVAPQVRLGLETAFEALEDAGITPTSVKGSNMGVWFAGAPGEGYEVLLHADAGYEAYNRFYGKGIALSTMCGRLSYLLDIHGPSITVDTACSGGMVALEGAVNYLQSGNGEVALVGAANTHVWPGTFGFLSAQKMASPNGRCATFTNEADGYVPSEAAVALVLKTRAAAERDGDTILAVVRSAAVGHNGRTQGLIAPSVKAQTALQRRLLQSAGLNPSNIDFFEAHGTGTALGDAMELQGITETFRGSHSASRPLIVGAAKACVGHTEAAAGLVGVAKALASFKHGAVPGLPRLTPENLNTAIDLRPVPLLIPMESVPLTKGPALGMVMAYGFAGTIAGTILERSTADDASATRNSTNAFPCVFTISAKTRDALFALAVSYDDFLSRAHDSNFRSICFTSCIGREQYRHRLTLVVNNLHDLQSQLREALAFTGQRLSLSGSSDARIMLAFPGQGSQYQGMAQTLSIFPGFTDILLSACKLASKYCDMDITRYLLYTEAPPAPAPSIDDSSVAPICIFIYQYATATWLKQVGVPVDAVLGHSIGEISAAALSDALSFETALQFVLRRTELMRPDSPKPSSMAVLFAPEQTVRTLIDKTTSRDCLEIAVYNSDDNHVVSGHRHAIDELSVVAASAGIKITALKVDQGFHSFCISAALQPLKEWLQERQSGLGIPAIPFLSSCLGEFMPEGASLSTEYWVDHARQPVRFSDAIKVLCQTAGRDIILDIGPRPFIVSAAGTVLSAHGKDTLAACGKNNSDALPSLLRSLAALHESGVTLNFKELWRSEIGEVRKVPLPTYRWQKRRYYPTIIPSRSRVAGASLSHVREVRQLDGDIHRVLQDHRIRGRIVLPAAGLAAFVALSRSNPTPKSFDSLTFHRPLIVDTEATDLYISFGTDNSITVLDNGATTPLCSGKTSHSHTRAVPSTYTAPTSPPTHTMTYPDIYARFGDVQFGPSFRNIRRVDIWPDRADALVELAHTELATTESATLLRALDACLHLFGAVHADGRRTGGSFLPHTLSGFTMHCEALPARFVCRYKLPLTLERGRDAMATSFSVFSLEGELLVSCDKYVVAWIPSDVIHPATHPIGEQDRHPVLALRYDWVVRPLPVVERAPFSLRILRFALSPEAKVQIDAFPRCVTIYRLREDGLPDAWKISSQDGEESLTTGSLSAFLQQEASLVVLDATGVGEGATYNGIMPLWQDCLAVLQILSDEPKCLAGVLVVSAGVRPHQAASSQSRSVIPCSFALGSVVQGMLRVFRSELQMDSARTFAVDLPFNARDDPALWERVLDEVWFRSSTSSELPHDALVLLQRNDQGVHVRYVPELVPESQDIGRPFSEGNVGVITGLGSIGQALGEEMLRRGMISGLVFLGRRRADDDTMNSIVKDLRVRFPGKPVEYIQCDLACVEDLDNIFGDIAGRLGSITHLVHTAGVVRDARLSNVSPGDIETVFRPKVLGAWNLHEASLSAGLQLRAFIMLSSISVPLGNEGQLAYVGANAFMDALAEHRRVCGLPAMSLQIGAWESDMVKEIDFTGAPVRCMTPQEGVDVVLNSMGSERDAVHVLAKLDVASLATQNVARDGMFRHVIAGRGAERADRSVQKTPLVVEQEFRKMLSKFLDLPEAQIDLSESLGAYGLDSIAFAQIRSDVVKVFRVTLPIHFLSDKYSLQDIASHIVKT